MPDANACVIVNVIMCCTTGDGGGTYRERGNRKSKSLRTRTRTIPGTRTSCRVRVQVPLSLFGFNDGVPCYRDLGSYADKTNASPS